MNSTKTKIWKTKIENHNLLPDPLFVDLYADESNNDVKELLILLHSGFYKLFNELKGRMKRAYSTSDVHLIASYSRLMIAMIEVWKEMTNNGVETIEELKTIIRLLDPQLSSSGGSLISKNEDISNFDFSRKLFFTGEVVVEKMSKIHNPISVGNGSFGKVYKYHDETLDKWIAFKKLNKYENESSISRFKKEFEILKSLSYCPQILRVYKFEEQQSRYFMDFCELGTLKEYLTKSGQNIDLDVRIDLCKQLIIGLKEVHSKSIFHRDLSWNNILLTQDGDKLVLKIADFGLCKDINDLQTKASESLKGHHVDPYLELFDKFNFSNEIYALAFVLNFILTTNEHLDLCSNYFKMMIGIPEARPKTLKEIFDFITNWKINTIINKQ